MRIYVGNLKFETTSQALRALFEPFGHVTEATVVTHRETGVSRGFGFVTMPNVEHGKAAIDATHGTELDGRTLVVNEAKPKPGGSRRNAGV